MKSLSTMDTTLKTVLAKRIPDDRKDVLRPMIEYVQEKIDHDKSVNLNFICTHNSRRSQFAQIWAKTAADYYHIPINSYSGGVEVTAFNERAVASLKRLGFDISVHEDGINPRYRVSVSANNSVLAFSKLFDDSINKAENFAAVMTCSHADENCPFIPGTEKRIPVRYEDPKEFDDTPQEAIKYDERSMQIAAEMFHVFSSIRKE